MIDYNNKNYYEVLGVDMNASPERIREAYERAKKIFIYKGFVEKIEEAYRILSDKNEREKYNIKLNESKMSDEEKEKYKKLEELKNKYNDSIDEISKLYDDEIYEYLKQNIQNNPNMPEKLRKYREKYNEAVKLIKEIEDLCNELNIKSGIENLDITISKFKEREEKQIRDGLELTKKYYKETLLEIGKLYTSENFNEKNEKWVNLISDAKTYYSQIVVLSNMLGMKVDIIFVDDYLKQQKTNKLNQDETKLERKYYNKLYELVNIYRKNKDGKLSEEDYNEWQNKMESVKQIYDEMIEFYKKNNITKPFLSPEDILHRNNIPINPEKIEKNVEEIYEESKYIQKGLNPNNETLFDEMVKTYKFNQKAHKLILTAVGAGLGFTLLISPIGGFGIVGSAIGSVLCGKLFNFITKKIQDGNKFKLTREGYAGIIKSINTQESIIIQKQNERLKRQIEKLAKTGSDNFELEVAKLKYKNYVNLLGQRIEIRKATKSKNGEFTANSLKLAALKQEYNRAKKFLSDVSKTIDRENMKKDVFAQDIDFDAIKYKNLTIGNFLIKQQINKNKKLKLTQHSGHTIVPEQENEIDSVRTR